MAAFSQAQIQSLTYQMGIDDSQYQAGAKRVQTANVNIRGSAEAVAKQVEQFSQSLAAGGTAFERFAARTDQVTRAQLKLRDELQKAQRLADLEGVSADQRARAYTNLVSSYVRTTAGMEKATGAQASMSAAMAQASAMASGYAARLGPLGAVLGALGPVGIAAAVGFTAIGLVMGAAIKEAEQFDQALARVSGVLKATGGAAGLTAGQVSDLAQEIQDTTLASDKAALDAAAALASIGSVSGDQFRRTLKLAQDMAAVFGGDLRGSAAALGRALDDPVRGLDRLRQSGVSFTAAQKEQIEAMARAGDLLGAQVAILDQVERKLGGAGQAERRGLTGASKGLADAWGDLLKEIGRTPAVVQSAMAVLGLLERMVRGLQPETADETHSRITRNLAAGPNTTGRQVSVIGARYAEQGDAAYRAAQLEELTRLEDQLQNARRRQQQATVAGDTAARERVDESLGQQAQAMDAVLVKLREEVRLSQMVADQREIATARAKAEADVIAAAGFKPGTSVHEVPPNVRATAETAADIAQQTKEREQLTKATAEYWKNQQQVLTALGEEIEKENQRRRAAGEGAKAENDRARAVIDTTQAIQGQIDALDQETRNLALDERTRHLQIELLKAETLARKDLTRGIMEQDRALTSGEREAVLEAANRNFDARKRADEDKKAADEATRAWSRGIDNVTDYGRDQFENMAEDWKGSIAGAGDALLGTFRRVFAQVAADNLLRPLVSQAASMLSGLGSQLAGGGGANDNFSFGNIVNTAIGGAAAGGFTPASLITGGLAIGGLALSALPKLFGGGDKESARREQAKQAQAAAATAQAWASLAQATAAAAESAKEMAAAAQGMEAEARQSLASLRGDTAAGFALLLEDNAKRLEEAKRVGASVALIDAQNAELRRDHLKRLSDVEFTVIEAQTTALEKLDRALARVRSEAEDLVNVELGQVLDRLTEAQQAVQAFASSASSMRSALFGLRTGNLSPQSPGEKLLAQRAEFERLAALALGGDARAGQDISAQAQAFLEASRAFNASGEAYAGDFARVEDVLARAADAAGVAEDLAKTQVELLEVHRDTLQDILRAIQDGNLVELKKQTEFLGKIHAVDLTSQASISGILAEAAQQTPTQVNSFDKLTSMLSVMQEQSGAERKERERLERERLEEERRIAEQRAARQAAVSGQRAAIADATFPSNPQGEGGITIGNTGSGTGGRFTGSYLNSGAATSQVAQMVSSLNFLMNTFGLSLQSFTAMTYSNTTLNPRALFNQLLPLIGLSGFAAGGIMTAYGPLALNRYSGGGIADRPQLALFGEGRVPEAYVPVPSGRIPVELRGVANDNSGVIEALRQTVAVLGGKLDAVRRELGDVRAELAQTRRVEMAV